MTGNFVQMEVSCSIGQLYAEKMRIDRHLSVLLMLFRVWPNVALLRVGEKCCRRIESRSISLQQLRFR